MGDRSSTAKTPKPPFFSNPTCTPKNAFQPENAFGGFRAPRPHLERDFARRAANCSAARAAIVPAAAGTSQWGAGRSTRQSHGQTARKAWQSVPDCLLAHPRRVRHQQVCTGRAGRGRPSAPGNGRAQRQNSSSDKRKTAAKKLAPLEKRGKGPPTPPTTHTQGFRDPHLAPSPPHPR